jgi:hypothetical protein
MRLATPFLSTLLCCLCVPAAARQDQPLSKAELAKRGKAATVLVETMHGTGTGFCIDKTGLFLTNHHVVDRVRELGTVKLILDPNQKTQTMLTATIVRSDAAVDLALLRVAERPGNPFTALPLGSSENLSELQEVVVFGFPLGRSMSLRKGDYPNIAVSNASISALRNRAGVLEAVEISGGSVNRGHSGGPVLDDQGKVIGILTTGVPGSGLSRAVPVAKMRTFLSIPEIAIRLPTVRQDELHKPAEFAATVTQFTPVEGSALTVELRLKPNVGDERKFPMVLKDGTYRVQAVPAPSPTGPARLRVLITMEDAALTGEAADRPCEAGGKKFNLKDVDTFTGGTTPTLRLRDRTEIKAVPQGWEAIPVRLGKQHVTLDLGKADKVIVEPPQTISSIMATIVVRAGDKELARQEERLSIGGASTGSVAKAGDRPDKPVRRGPDVNTPTRRATDPGITPANLEEDFVERKLPSQVDRVVAGGGGRYLFLHLPRERQLAVFDASAAKIIKYLPMPSDTIKFTASLDLLLVYIPATNAIERWNLATWQKEVTLPCPVSGTVKEFLMGSGSHGPLIIGATGLPGERDRIGGLRFYDPHALKEIRYEPVQEQAARAGSFGVGFDDRHSTALRVSANGQTITCWNTSGSSGFQMILLQGTTYRTAAPPHQTHTRSGVPTPDGELICTEGHLFTADGQPLRPNESTHGAGVWFVPAVQGKYHLAYREVGGKQAELSIHLQGEKAELLRYRNLRGLDKLIEWVGGHVSPFEQHLFFIPQAGLLVFLPHTRDKLLLYKFDLDASLEASGIDYLVVTSAAPKSVKKGTAFEYQLDVKSKRKGVQYQLDSGPEGMKISAEGKVTWDVPANYDGEEVSVILTVRDASGQEVLHSFKLKVAGG